MCMEGLPEILVEHCRVCMWKRRQESMIESVWFEGFKTSGQSQMVSICDLYVQFW